MKEVTILRNAMPRAGYYYVTAVVPFQTFINLFVASVKLRTT